MEENKVRHEDQNDSEQGDRLDTEDNSPIRDVAEDGDLDRGKGTGPAGMFCSNIC